MTFFYATKLTALCLFVDEGGGIVVCDVTVGTVCKVRLLPEPETTTFLVFVYFKSLLIKHQRRKMFMICGAKIVPKLFLAQNN